MTHPDPAGLGGLYFGELELVAYEYRPGESIQALDGASGFMGCPGGATGDWSVWPPLVSGYEESRNYVLQTGQSLRFDELLAEGDRRRIPEDFAATVGAFDIDCFDVFVHNTGVVYDDVFYGSWSPGSPHRPLYRYTQWDSATEHQVLAEFPAAAAVGTTSPAPSASVLFVRDDWFPTSVIIDLDADTNAANPVVSTSRPLTASELGYVESLLGHCTSRRSAVRIFVIPFDGPVTVDLTGG
jgi:hypothetical protein